MNLAEYQRAFLRVSFAREPSAEDLRILGDEERVRLYRHMVRTRLLGMARNAFRFTCEELGEARFREAFDRFLCAEPPRSPLIRDVIAAFGTFALAEAGVFEDRPVAFDLLRFELSKWQVAYQQADVPAVGVDAVRELDFDGALVLNPVLVVLELQHPVHQERKAWLTESRVSLLVYRPPQVDEVRFWAVAPFFAELLKRASREPTEPLAEAVRATSRLLTLVLDQKLLETLSDHLTLAVQRGVIIGVR